MGIAAYNRGTKAMRDQIEASQAGLQYFNDLQHYRHVTKELQATIADQRAKLERAAKAFRALELSRTIEREQAAERLEAERRVTALYRDMVLAGYHQSCRSRSLIGWLKGLLTFAGVTIGQRDAYEAELALDGERYQLGPFSEGGL